MRSEIPCIRISAMCACLCLLLSPHLRVLSLHTARQGVCAVDVALRTRAWVSRVRLAAFDNNTRFGICSCIVLVSRRVIVSACTLHHLETSFSNAQLSHLGVSARVPHAGMGGGVGQGLGGGGQYPGVDEPEPVLDMSEFPSLGGRVPSVGGGGGGVGGGLLQSMSGGLEGLTLGQDPYGAVAMKVRYLSATLSLSSCLTSRASHPHWAIKSMRRCSYTKSCLANERVLLLLQRSWEWGESHVVPLSC